jgi:hypothetical protein
MSRRFRSSMLLVSILLLFVTPAFAQIDRATIEVIVTDQSEAALPGVTVTLRRPETGYSVTDVTSSQGIARFAALVPAHYEFDVELAGFATVSEKNVVVRVGQTLRIPVELRAAASESITVSAGEVLVDLYKQDTSTNIVPEQIELLPVADRDFQKLAFIAPGVQRERGGFRFITGGPVIGSGGNASQSTIMVDGVDYTDPALGLSRTRFSQDAIQEFRVITNRFDAEIGGSAGGALSIITKTGTNDLKGTAFGFYRADDLREPGALETGEVPYERSQFGFTLGGPIVRDRTQFFASVEQINEDNVSLVKPGGLFATQATDVEHPFDQTLAFASVTQQLSDSMNFGGKVVFERYREDNFRVGGVADESYGQELNRDNANLSLDHTWILSSNTLNDIRFQLGRHKYDEPTNSNGVAEWFSSGTTLQTGGNILGDLMGEGDNWEIREVFQHTLGERHNIKTGLTAQRIDERFRLNTYETGLFIYVTDTRALPLAYAFGIGSADVETDTMLYGAFINDEWRPTTNLTLNVGIRYDLDTDGNNADLDINHPLISGRDQDTDNIQPRASFSWDMNGRGDYVLRGGAGLFTGRFLLVPALTELQANGVTGRLLQTRINGALLGLPQFALDPANPTTTGIPSKPDITILANDLEAPESTQLSLGMTTRIGSTGLFFDTEALYIEGDNEIAVRDVNWSGNGTRTRPNTTFNQINTYTNDGRSEYKALILALNGTIFQKHLITSSVTVSDKKNINDDFSPEFPFGYPNDPADMDAEWGHGRSHERYRVVLSGVFRMPWDFTIAPIYEYGSGQPWTRRLGYDYNGDGKNSDRAAGVGRFDDEGPDFNALSLRLTKAIALGGFGKVDLIAEAFNVTDETNYDVASIDGAEFLSGPTLANPTLAARPNPNFGNYRSTLPGREIQLGLRWGF